MALSLLQDSVPTSGLVAAPRRAMKDATPGTRGDSPAELIDGGSLSPPLSTSSSLVPPSFSGIHHPALINSTSLFPGQPPLTLPVSLHATLASGPALFHKFGALFGWPKTSRRANNNNHVSSTSNNPVAKKNQANRRRTGKKTEPVEPATIEVAAMTQLPPAQLSPPTSGSSPPSEPKSSSGEGRDARDKVFTCGVCARSFGYKHVLQNHERTHTGEKPFECGECHKRFTRDHHLKTHMRLHTGEKPYHCTHCDRQFVQVANLRRHLRVHTGERPYACELCTSRFSDSNQLKAHMLIHKGEKPFGCERCHGRFRRRHHMMHHKCPGAKDDKARRPADLEELDDELEVEEEEDDDGMILAHNNNGTKKSRGRKSREVRHVIRSPDAGAAPMMLPEQTEPEDLSMRNYTVLGHSSGDSPSPRSDEDDLLYLQHRHPKFRRRLPHT